MHGRLGEALFNLAIVVLGALVIAGSIRLGLGSPDTPGPGLFPFLAGVAIVVPQCVVLIRFFSRGGEDDRAASSAGSLRTLAALVGIFCGWIVVMPLVGYVVITFVAVVAFARVLGLAGWTKPLALAAATALGIYLLFERLLFIDLPRGPFG